MNATTSSSELGLRVRAILEGVHDPEIPTLTIAELGILRDVRVEGGRVTVVITPTYSGCPAMHTIEQDIYGALAAAGLINAHVETQIGPAWSSDWLSPAAHDKLRAVGIAPPLGSCSDQSKHTHAARLPPCPQCGASSTELISEFGSTACKALYRCRSCLEPFDYFKCL
jgi:ring-1,2-phenylacetyl-CoA epoxidase subunit PaaD